MTNCLLAVQQWLESHKPQIIQELTELLKIPSISTDPAYSQSVHQACDWLADYLSRMGLEVEIIQTKRYPILIAKRHVNSGLPHIVIYNHYDVQPVDPLNLWDHPPFEPFIDGNDEIFARGAQDNKGQLWAVIQGVKALLSLGTLPCNITLCIEGEEESGSLGLQAILPQIKDKLRSDALFVVDVDIPEKDRPSVTMSIRGNITMTLEIIGSKSDLHSGMHGGIVYNPNHALVQVLASLRDPENGKILVDGFYDDVAMPSAIERQLINFEFDAKAYEAAHGAKPIGGETDFSPLESNWLRPTLEINGISGGYAGEGFKTVIPAKAIAKISCRIVPNQDPRKVCEALQRHIQQHIPKGLEAKITVHSTGRWARVDPQGKALKSVRQAYEEVFKKRCEGVMSGASVPIIASLVEATGSDVVFFGYGLSSDNIHAPNEHYGIDRLIALACIVARSIELFGTK